MTGNKKIGFVGAGKMGGAIIKGLIKSGFASAENIIAAEINEEFAQKTSEELGIKVITDNNELVETSDYIVFCTKPFVLIDVLKGIKNSLTENKVLLSIAAGKNTKTIEEAIKKPISVIRVMPNTPALVNEGMTAVCKGKYSTDEHINFAVKLFSSVGKCIEVQESDMDAVTGISGSGPAFFYEIIEAMADGGVKLGLSKEKAIELAAQTALGAAKMVLETDKSPSVLRQEVTTPGGTTEQGLLAMEKHKIHEAMIDTVIKTAKKSAQMGK